MNPVSELMLTLSSIVDLTDRGHLRHGERVVVVAYYLGRQCSAAPALDLLYAGLAHDIGSVPAPYHITQYRSMQAQLAEQRIVMHPVLGSEVLREVPAQQASADLVLEHHERWDGRGYPSGKRGDETSLGSQVLRLADALELALRFGPSPRPPAVEGVLPAEEIGRGFSEELYGALLDALSDAELWRRVCDDAALADLVQELLEREETLPLEGPSEPTERELDPLLAALARVIDLKHPYTARHSARVSRYAEETASALGLPAEQVRDVRRAALLHDLGKSTMSRELLDVCRTLTRKEHALLKTHPLRTYSLMQGGYLRPLAPMTAYHHAWWDGRGYPEGLAGEAIPLGARIIAVADAFDAITTWRPYRPTRTAREAFAALKEGAGTQFDPTVVQVAERALSQG